MAVHPDLASQMEGSLSRLLMVWSDLRHGWSDDVAARFEKEAMVPLGDAARRYQLALVELEGAIASAMRELEIDFR